MCKKLWCLILYLRLFMPGRLKYSLLPAFAVLLTLFAKAQTCDNPGLLCFGNNFTVFDMDTLPSGLDAPCFDADNSVYLSFTTNDIGGEVNLDIGIGNCNDSAGFDDELSVAIIETNDLCNGPYNYLACNGATSGAISVNAMGLLPNTTYYVQVDGDLNGIGITDAAQCQFNPVISGSGVELPISLSLDEFIVSGGSVELIATGGDQYNWQPDESLSNPMISNPIASPTENTEYTVEIINGACVVTRRVWVFVFEPISIYDAFTPNGDGINDDWVIERIEDFPQCSINIFDRWGQLVYTSVGYPIPWDGTRNGNPLTAGNYYYVIELNNDEVDTTLFTGSVTIIY